MSELIIKMYQKDNLWIVTIIVDKMYIKSYGWATFHQCSDWANQYIRDNLVN